MGKADSAHIVVTLDTETDETYIVLNHKDAIVLRPNGIIWRPNGKEPNKAIDVELSWTELRSLVLKQRQNP